MSSRLMAATVGAYSLLAAGALGGCSHRPAPESEPRAVLDSEAEAEAVDVGYGARRRSDVTFAISSMTRERIQRLNATSVADLLELIPGLRVTRSMGNFSVRIRAAPGEPLFVVDGTPLVASGASAVATLTPENIERIDVLKDGGAAAVYGLQGANGVILITTRRPGYRR